MITHQCTSCGANIFHAEDDIILEAQTSFKCSQCSSEEKSYVDDDWEDDGYPNNELGNVALNT